MAVCKIVVGHRIFTLKKKLFNAGLRLNTVALKNGVGPWCYFVRYGAEEMINLGAFRAAGAFIICCQR